MVSRKHLRKLCTETDETSMEFESCENLKKRVDELIRLQCVFSISFCVGTQERGQQKTKELIEYLKTQAEKLVKENADTVQGVQECAHMLSAIMVTEERLNRTQRNKI